MDTSDFAAVLRAHGDVVEYDEHEGWLVQTQPNGASAIIARDVEPGFGRWVAAQFDADPVRVIG